MRDKADAQIADAILSFSTDNWLKTAKITAEVMDFFEDRSDAFLDQILNRIRDLTDNGKLEANGDILNMRHSELRRRS